MGCGAGIGAWRGSSQDSIEPFHGNAEVAVEGVESLDRQSHTAQSSTEPCHVDAVSTADCVKPSQADYYLGHENRGVSPHYLLTGLLEEMDIAGLPRTAKVYEIESPVIIAKGRHVICPRDGQEGAAYVDCVYGEQCAGLATLMLSYTWGYAVGDISDCLINFCELKGLDPKKTFVWICCLCINQHRVRAARAKNEVVPFSTFQSAFGQRVEGIGWIVAMMAPWEAPGYITRVWCCFEMFVATQLACEGKCKVHVVMPPDEVHAMLVSLRQPKGVSGLFDVLSALDVEKANASVLEDKERILGIIAQGPGFQELNSRVGMHLMNWVVETCWQNLETHLKLGDLDSSVLVTLCNTVGYLLRRVGSFERALRALREGLSIHEDVGTLDTPAGANLLVNIAIVHGLCKDVDSQIEAFDRAMQIRQRTGTLVTREGALLWKHLGITRGKRNDFVGAEEAFENARSVFEQLDLLESADGASLLRDIGSFYKDCGKIDIAIDTYAKARRIRASTDSLQTPEGATLLREMGELSMKQLDFVSAEAFYEKARIIFQQTGTLTSKSGKELTRCISMLRELQKDGVPGVAQP